MVEFEKVNKYKDVDFNLPQRKTTESAGYDFYVAEDIVIPSYSCAIANLTNPNKIFTLNEMANFTKSIGLRPTLVSTGVKCKMAPDQYLELMVRSSTPLKYWLILANGVGIIDADYYNNPDNEGEIFFQLINLSPSPIQLKRGDCIGQGIIKTYNKVNNDTATNSRTGGFGSTNPEILPPVNPAYPLPYYPVEIGDRTPYHPAFPQVYYSTTTANPATIAVTTNSENDDVIMTYIDPHPEIQIYNEQQ